MPQQDVAALYQQLTRVIDTPTIVSQADDIAAIFLLQFNPQADIFNYFQEVKRLVKKVHDSNSLLPRNNQLELPDGVVRALLIRAMKQQPMYKPTLDAFIARTPEEWAQITSEELCKRLEQVTTVYRGVQQEAIVHSKGAAKEPVVRANKVQVKKGACFDFAKSGICSRSDCKFSHDALAPTPSAAPVSGESKTKCFNCGGPHVRTKCKFTGKCSYCGAQGHTENMCRKKKTGKPQALMLDADGVLVQSNLLLVHDQTPRVEGKALVLHADAGNLKREIFFADTGANRHIHQDASSATQFHATALHIGTAQQSGGLDGII